MNKKWLSLIILFICLSLAGIIAVQYMWIRNAFDVREAQFNQGVNDALDGVVTRLETSENMQLIRQRLISDSILNLIRSYAKDSMTLEQSQIDLDQLQIALYGKPLRVKSRSGYFSYDYDHAARLQTNYQMSLTWSLEQQKEIDSIMEQIEDFIPIEENIVLNQFQWQESQIKKLDSLWIEQEKLIHKQEFDTRVDFETENEHYSIPEIHITRPDPPRPEYKRADNQTRSDPRVIVRHNPTELIVVNPQSPDAQKKASKVVEHKIKKLNKRTKQLQDLIQRMAIEYEEFPKAVEARIDKKMLKSTLNSSLADNNINIPFEFAVYNPVSDSNPIPIHSTGFTSENLASDHKISLFPNDVIEKPDQLLVYFPGQQSHIAKSLSFLMLGSLLFTMIIIFSSGLSIFVMIRHKKISDIKTDFINNMTHEFKTPIATISIAADSINNPKVIEKPTQIKSYTRIIKEENSRMNSRVEQVLQMSLLDSRDFKLFMEPINLQELIQRTVNHFKLIVEKRGGTIQTEFEATEQIVEIDESHMRNVLMNLLDNANKYSLEKPDITIHTENRSGCFYFCIKDKGMGMSKDVQKRVFDKFYRLTSGNVHNIKGFGLGLSYVKAIVMAHHGEIKIDSEQDKGSCFEIGLPLYNKQQTTNNY